jgi:hypothetical protein
MRLVAGPRRNPIATVSAASSIQRKVLQKRRRGKEGFRCLGDKEEEDEFWTGLVF